MNPNPNPNAKAVADALRGFAIIGVVGLAIVGGVWWWSSRGATAPTAADPNGMTAEAFATRCRDEVSSRLGGPRTLLFPGDAAARAREQSRDLQAVTPGYNLALQLQADGRQVFVKCAWRPDTGEFRVTTN